MIGGHLRQAEGRPGRDFVKLAAPRYVIAGFNERLVVRVAFRQQFVRHAREFVDIELVVGEQDIILEIFGRRGGVMLQPVQRIIDPRRGERRQRIFAAGLRFMHAIDDGIVHDGNIGHIEIVP